MALLLDIACYNGKIWAGTFVPNYVFRRNVKEFFLLLMYSLLNEYITKYNIMAASIS